MHRHDIAARELSIRRARYRIEADALVRTSGADTVALDEERQGPRPRHRSASGLRLASEAFA